MKKASIICVVLLPMALCARPVAGANGKTINVLSFGAKGDGDANDAPALNRAVAEGARLGPGTTVHQRTGKA